MTTQSVQTDATWKSRPLLSAGVRLLAYGTPIVIGTVVVRAVSPSLNEAFSRLPATMTALALAVTVSLLVSRLTMRLMPLVVLLRMTMLFPDHAPSRYQLARAAGRTAILEERARAHPEETAGEAATRILGLLTALGVHDPRTRGHSGSSPTSSPRSCTCPKRLATGCAGRHFCTTSARYACPQTCSTSRPPWQPTSGR